MDINPQGDLNEYFQLESARQDQDFFLLMNDDPILGSDNIFQESFGYSERLLNTEMNKIIQNTMDYTTYKKSVS